MSTQNSFIRNVQITGDVVTGNLYIAGMDEGGGGFPHNDTNYLYKSTDGGNSWTNVYIGAPFPGPGVTAVGYFACMFSDNGGYWRYEGWGEPAALNGVVHLVYARHGAGGTTLAIFITFVPPMEGRPLALRLSSIPITQRALNGCPACQRPQMAVSLPHGMISVKLRTVRRAIRMFPATEYGAASPPITA